MRLEDFYADARRRVSPEVALASGWTSTADPGAAFSLYWVAETGEVCALRHGPVAIGPGAPKPYGVYFPAMKELGVPDQEVTVLASGIRRDDAAAAVDAADSSRRTLEWLREELATVRRSADTD